MIDPRVGFPTKRFIALTILFLFLVVLTFCPLNIWIIGDSIIRSFIRGGYYFFRNKEWRNGDWDYIARRILDAILVLIPTVFALYALFLSLLSLVVPCFRPCSKKLEPLLMPLFFFTTFFFFHMLWLTLFDHFPVYHQQLVLLIVPLVPVVLFSYLKGPRRFLAALLCASAMNFCQYYCLCDFSINRNHSPDIISTYIVPFLGLIISVFSALVLISLMWHYPNGKRWEWENNVSHRNWVD